MPLQAAQWWFGVVDVPNSRSTKLLPSQFAGLWSEDGARQQVLAIISQVLLGLLFALRSNVTSPEMEWQPSERAMLRLKTVKRVARSMIL